jgi:type VI secretion system secreted protein Hcp
MKKIAVSMAAVLLFIATSAFAAAPIYVDIDGAKQGKFRSETPKGIPAYKLNYEVKSPRDVASGMVSGKRQHLPICFTKELSSNTPQIFQSITTNEVLKSVNFRFVKLNPNGEEYAYFTIKLTNAVFSNYKLITGAADSSAAGSAKHAVIGTDNLEDVCVTFQKIEMLGPDGKPLAMDDWTK